MILLLPVTYCRRYIGSLGVTLLVALSVQSLTGEKDSRGGGESWQNVKKMIYVKYNPKTNVAAGHWPIPESFWPDMNTKTLVQSPARKCTRYHTFLSKQLSPITMGQMWKSNIRCLYPTASDIYS